MNFSWAWKSGKPTALCCWIRYFYLQRRMRYVCYQERQVKTARSKNFTPFMAALFILVAVNYYKTPFCFHDMRCDLLKLFINPTILFHLVLKHFYLRLPWAAVHCDRSHTRKRKKEKRCCQEKVRRNKVSEKWKPSVESCILQKRECCKTCFSIFVIAVLTCLCLFVYF